MIENLDLDLDLDEKENVRDGEVLNPLLPQNPPPLGLDVTETEVKPSRHHQSNGTMPVRKLVKLAKICGVVSVLAVLLIVVTALLAHRPITHRIIDTFHTHVKSSLSHIVIESSENQRNSLIFTESNSNSAHYLSLSIPYNKLLSRNDDPQSKRCQFSHFVPNSQRKDKRHPRHEQICLEFEDQIQAAIYETDMYEGLECYVVHWYSQNIKNPSIKNCINMATDKWYGGGSLSVHRWPLNRAKISMQPFITRQFDKILSHETDAHFTSFLEPYFLSAKGVAVIPECNLPLFVSIRENGDKVKQMCFKSALEKPFDKVATEEDSGIHLNYTVCKASSAKAVQQLLLKSGLLPHPKRQPSSEVLQKPVWSTRGQNISNEMKMIKFVTSIKNSGVKFSQLFIDGNYTKSVGSYYFNEKTFPRSAQLIMELDEQLPEKKLKVSTQVYPFIPEYISDKNFSFNSVKKSSGNHDPLLLDVFCEEAREWYMSKLKDIQLHIHVNGFRFSGGEAASFLKYDGSMKPLNITKKYSFNEITTQYSNIASQFLNGSFIGSGYRSQVHGMVADAGPFLSSWNHRKGIKSIIPTVITLGLIGYPFVLAGPVGGVNYDQQSGHFELPPEDLYIRWLQLSIHLPVIEFSVGPWEYGPEVMKYARNLLDHRQNVLWPEYLSAAVKEAVDIGTPIIRPLWWIAPDDETAQYIDCEFLVNNHLLVAPVLYPSQTARDVYLPEGHGWQDLLHGKFYEGGQWLPQFPVNISQVATFVIKALPQSNN